MDSSILERGEQTKSDILQAAHHLFIKKGFHGSSMRQISQEAGIALGGIYNHYASKEDIFLEVILTYHPYIQTLPVLAAAEGATLEEYVRDIARRLISALGERLDFINLMFIELVEFEGKHLQQIFQQIFPKLLDFSRQFADRENLLRPIPPLVLVRVFLGLFYSYVLTEIIISRQMPIEMKEDSLDYFIDIFLHGILAESK